MYIFMLIYFALNTTIFASVGDACMYFESWAPNKAQTFEMIHFCEQYNCFMVAFVASCQYMGLWGYLDVIRRA
jgi:hypothetical protein